MRAPAYIGRKKLTFSALARRGSEKKCTLFTLSRTVCALTNRPTAARINSRSSHLHALRMGEQISTPYVSKCKYCLRLLTWQSHVDLTLFHIIYYNYYIFPEYTTFLSLEIFLFSLIYRYLRVLTKYQMPLYLFIQMLFSLIVTFIFVRTYNVILLDSTMTCKEYKVHVH